MCLRLHIGARAHTHRPQSTHAPWTVRTFTNNFIFTFLLLSVATRVRVCVCDSRFAFLLSLVPSQFVVQKKLCKHATSTFNKSFVLSSVFSLVRLIVSLSLSSVPTPLFHMKKLFHLACALWQQLQSILFTIVKWTWDGGPTSCQFAAKQKHYVCFCCYGKAIAYSVCIW